MDSKQSVHERNDAPVASNQPPNNPIRVNYHEDCEGLVNRQINMELYASYVYLALAYHFDRYDVALKGHTKYFKKNDRRRKGTRSKIYGISK